ncbi:hypothetical protein BH11BAC3_BH11BAC3_38710 [soil metagenome]
METTKDIQDELMTLSPLLAGLAKVNVFSVPEGYFDSITDTVIACIHESAEGFVFQKPAANLSVPEGYFENLADSILLKVKSAQTSTAEINELSPLLAGIDRKQVFEVPAGYFENNPGIINEKIATSVNAKEELRQLSRLLLGVQHTNVFEVPTGYFENNPAIIIGKTGIPVEGKEELMQLSPLLAGIQHKNVLAVPTGYFEGLATEIIAKLKPEPTTGRVVKIGSRNLFIKFAAAAMLIGAIAFGIIKYTDKPGKAGTVETAAIVLDPSIEQGKKMNDEQFAAALENLSATDISKYLEKHGDITDMAVLRNNLDETQLPSEEDYLLNDKALENYLNKLDLTTLNN